MAHKNGKGFKKNSLVILALSVMIGIAGYLNFSESREKKDIDKTMAGTEDAEVISYNEDEVPDDVTGEENMEDTAEDTDEFRLSSDDEDTGEVQLNSDEEDIGEAVLTGGPVTGSNISTAKLTREQNRSKSREALLNIINDDTIDEASREDAIASYVELNDKVDMESDTETLLLAKGFSDAIVTIGDNYVDVALNVENVDDTTRAQIEDIVTRKTGRPVSEIVISVAGEK